MKYALLAFSLLVVGCSSGGGASSPTALPVVAPSAPASTPSTTPTTVPLFVLQAAPLTSTPTILASGRRAQSGTSLLPIMVEGSGFTPGPLAVWVADATTGKDVAETTGSATGATFAPLVCPGASALWCAVHSAAWLLTPPTGLATGQHTLTVAFGDGTSGAMTDDVYDWFTLTCGAGWVYAGGVITPTASRAVSDVYDDCAAGNVVFPRGAILASNPVADAFGRFETVLSTMTAAINLTSLFTNAPSASITQGQVYGISTQDGGFAKVYFVTPTQGLALHAKADGSYAF